MNIMIVTEGNGLKVPAWLFLSSDADTHGQREAIKNLGFLLALVLALSSAENVS